MASHGPGRKIQAPNQVPCDQALALLASPVSLSSPTVTANPVLAAEIFLLLFPLSVWNPLPSGLCAAGSFSPFRPGLS